MEKSTEELREKYFTFFNACKDVGFESAFCYYDTDNGKIAFDFFQSKYELLVEKLSLEGIKYHNGIGILQEHIERLGANSGNLYILKSAKKETLIVRRNIIAEIFDYQIESDEFVIAKILFSLKT